MYVHGNVAKQKSEESMTKKHIHRLLVQYRALSWAARELQVNKGTLHRFLSGERPVSDSLDLKGQAEKLALRLAVTQGKAKNQ